MSERLRLGIDLLRQAIAAGLMVWSEGDDLCIEGPESAESIASKLVENKSRLLPALQDRRLEIVKCPGDDCDRRILLIDGEGWCSSHRMTVRVIEKACA